MGGPAPSDAPEVKAVHDRICQRCPPVPPSITSTARVLVGPVPGAKLSGLQAQGIIVDDPEGT